MNFNDHVSAVSNLSVLMSKFDVMRPCNFHKVLKTSVRIDVKLVCLFVCLFVYLFSRFKHVDNNWAYFSCFSRIIFSHVFRI